MESAIVSLSKAFEVFGVELDCLEGKITRKFPRGEDIPCPSRLLNRVKTLHAQILELQSINDKLNLSKQVWLFASAC